MDYDNSIPGFYNSIPGFCVCSFNEFAWIGWTEGCMNGWRDEEIKGGGGMNECMDLRDGLSISHAAVFLKYYRWCKLNYTKLIFFLGHYIVVEGSTGEKGDKARIRKALTNLTSTPNCLDFFYHMSGSPGELLSVYVSSDDIDLVWTSI